MSYRRRILRAKRARRATVERWLKDAVDIVWAALPLEMTMLTPPDKKWFSLKVTKR
jgi:hypothetical protein